MREIRNFMPTLVMVVGTVGLIFSDSQEGDLGVVVLFLLAIGLYLHNIQWDLSDQVEE